MPKIIKRIVLLLIVLFTVSCAYYNGLHNAKKLFAEAEEMELDSKGRVSRDAKSKYNKVIKKCGTILEFYSESTYVDDAIYLMAMSFYRKGGNLTKAIEQCDKIIDYFPESEFYVDAVILKAQVLRDKRKPDESYTLLEEMMMNPKYSDGKSKVLLKIAEFYTGDENYSRARYYLNTIITDYRKSLEAKKASYFLGLNYMAEENYAEAITAIKQYLKLDNDREEENDANYNLAYCYFKTGDYRNALKRVDDLIDDEYRKAQKNDAKVLKGQILLADSGVEEGIELLNELVEGNQKGAASAKANYILGDYYLTNTDSLKLSIKLFNAVKKADSNSEYVEQAIAKSSVASQIQLFKDSDEELQPKELVDEQFKLAEYYLDIMALPDSAIAVYNDIIDNKMQFAIKKDTLLLKQDSLSIAVDSLTNINDNMSSEIDSLRFLVENTNTLADSTITSDSLRTEDPNGQRMLMLEAEQDSLVQLLDSKRSQLQSVTAKIENLSKVIKQFDTEYIPFASFVKIMIYNDNLQDSLQVKRETSFLLDNFPDSKYAFAISQSLNGQEMKLITPEEELSKLRYKELTRHMLTEADTTITLLEANMQDLQDSDKIKAQMALAYLYLTAKKDTVSARTYFDSLATNINLVQEQQEWVEKFYKNGDFLFNQVEEIQDNVEDDIAEDNSNDIEVEDPASDINKDEDNDKLEDDDTVDKAEDKINDAIKIQQSIPK